MVRVFSPSSNILVSYFFSNYVLILVSEWKFGLSSFEHKNNKVIIIKILIVLTSTWSSAAVGSCVNGLIDSETGVSWSRGKDSAISIRFS